MHVKVDLKEKKCDSSWKTWCNGNFDYNVNSLSPLKVYRWSIISFCGLKFISTFFVSWMPFLYSTKESPRSIWIVVASKHGSKPSFSSSSTIILCKITHNEKIWNYILIPSSKKCLEKFHIHFVRPQRFVQHLSRLFHVIVHSACTCHLVVHELFVGILTSKGRWHPSIGSIWNNYSHHLKPKVVACTNQ